MWFKDKIIYPRHVKSFLVTILLQELYVSSFFLIIKLITWHPMSGVLDWFYYMLHWKTIVYQIILCLTTVGFGFINMRFYTVEKNVSSNRFEKICKYLSPYSLQHFLVTSVLGGIIALCCIALFNNFHGEKSSFIESGFILKSDFEHLFVIGHGCFTGIMFSLKYFICSLYLVKFTLNQEKKFHHIRQQMTDLFRESVMCVLKSAHWYYLCFIIFGPFLKNSLSSFLGTQLNVMDSIYLLINLKMLLVTLTTGIIIFLNWSLYLFIFNTFASERHIFAIEVPIKGDKNKVLAKALMCSECSLLRYLAVLDLRLLAQHDMNRRQEIFSISHPGGHPHQWKAISEICITSLQTFVYKLQEFSVMSASLNSKSNFTKNLNSPLGKITSASMPDKTIPSLTEQVYTYFRERPAVTYFFDELPNTKMMRLFASSQPLIWMTEALGYLVCASYEEDKYGVIQQTLPQIICLLLDLKMAEEKMPVGLVGIRTHVKDPQGRYEHIHQRLSLKTTVNSVLCRIALAFQNDISGIYLPEEYLKYFQRYLNRKNA